MADIETRKTLTVQKTNVFIYEDYFRGSRHEVFSKETIFESNAIFTRNQVRCYPFFAKLPTYNL